MSRIGRKPIKIEDNVKVEVTGSVVTVTGPKGSLSMTLLPEVKVVVSEGIAVVEKASTSKNASMFWGLTRALLANMVRGVVSGYEQKLEFVGVGYRVKQESTDKVTMTLGFSHPVEFVAPEGISLKVEDQQHLTISGIDKQAVGMVAANIRKLRKPEPYKGKGIRYVGEVVRRKQGKAGKA